MNTTNIILLSIIILLVIFVIILFFILSLKNYEITFYKAKERNLKAQKRIETDITKFINSFDK